MDKIIVKKPYLDEEWFAIEADLREPKVDEFLQEVAIQVKIQLEVEPKMAMRFFELMERTTLSFSLIDK